MVSSILPLKVVHMWYKVWTWSQTRSHSGHFQVGIQNPSISRSELKIIIDQKWYTWEKNVVNTINGPYKKADLKKKKFRDFETYKAQNGQKLIFTLRPETNLAPHFFWNFLAFFIQISPNDEHIKNLAHTFAVFERKLKTKKILIFFATFRHENGPPGGATGKN